MIRANHPGSGFTPAPLPAATVEETLRWADEEDSLDRFWLEMDGMFDESGREIR